MLCLFKQGGNIRFYTHISSLIYQKKYFFIGYFCWKGGNTFPQNSFKPYETSENLHSEVNYWFSGYKKTSVQSDRQTIIHKITRTHTHTHPVAPSIEIYQKWELARKGSEYK